MPAYTRLSDDELKAQLKTLQSRSGVAGKSAQSKQLQHDLQVHQIELEMQNRELRETQHDLQIARDRYADLYDLAPVGYLTLDPKGYIREINLTGAAMLGQSRLHIVGQPFSAWLARGEARTFFAHLRTVVQTGQRATAELRVKGRGHKLLNVCLESVSESEGFGGCRTAMTDVTEVKRREQAEREREAELAHLARVSTLGAVASTIAHEITQPLSAMVGYAAAAALSLRKQPEEPQAVIDALEKIVALGQRAGEIVHSISDFSRKGEALRVPLQLNDVVQDAASLVAAAAHDAGVEIELDLTDDLPPVNGNGVQLEQVAVNLIMNGIESIQAHGGDTRHVTVRTAVVGGAVRLTVTDTGCGLTPEVAERMFQPFFSTKQNGHGIGLALCKTIIESHNGRIWTIRNLDGGATVAFNLPVKRDLADARFTPSSDR